MQELRSVVVEATVARLRDLTRGEAAFGDVLALGEDAVPALERLLRDATATVYEPRCLAADALAALGEAGFAALLRAFNDSLDRDLDPVLLDAETVVLSRIAHHLGRRRDPRATETLLGALALRPFAEVARALGQIGDARAIPLIVECLYDDSARAAAMEALQAFGALPLRALMRVLAAPRIKNGFESASCVDARAAAAALLGRMEVDAVQLALVWSLHDEQTEVRLAAAEALAGRIDPSGEIALPTLIELLGDERWTRSERAAEALAAIDGPAIQPLIDLLAREETSVDGSRRHRYAIQLLGRLAPSRAVALLSHLSSHDSLEVRLSALRALAAVSTPAADAAVARYLGDEQPAVRHRAVEILAARGVAAAPSLVRALGHPDAHVRRRAEEALRALGASAREALLVGDSASASDPWIARWRRALAMRRIMRAV